MPIFNPVWIATLIGLFAGVVLAYQLGKTLLPRAIAATRHVTLAVRLAIAGTVVALIPAFLLSLVVGGTLGGAWGKRALDELGFPASGAPIGLALGIAVVFALVLVGGALLGILLARGLLAYRQWRLRA
ncbi:MAG TPA: hypothetical protein VFV84_02415 [Burkholderiales bacterium]|nr:hypothetical protein [Burkholderiales bacterium]